MNEFHVSLKLTASAQGFLIFSFLKRGILSRKTRIRFEVHWWIANQCFVQDAGYRSMLKWTPDALEYLQKIIPVLEKNDLLFLQTPLNRLPKTSAKLV